MSQKGMKYAEGPMKDVRRVRDDLPPPDQLVFRQDTVKVTLALSKSSVEFFKDVARRRKGKYQQMIRQLIDTYVEQHKPNR
jgi:hypothetical protein